jgi:hypothetical protein
VLATHNENKNIKGGINEFRRCYQLRNILVKDDNGDLLADTHNILNRRRSCFSQLLNVHVSDIRQIEVHTAERSVLGPCRLEAEIAIANLSGSDQILAKIMQRRDEILHEC